ncbi:MAG: NAD-dependent epimerase/dehydratase family protein [Chitinophagaceae bacterium]|nr:MAG: NAD-dependent epimerase/dehydratase family protein [Chitinophagaceae bacterium]
MIVPQPPGLPVIVAGATGHLGRRIVQHLLQRGAQVRALVRKGTHAAHPELAGATIFEVDYTRADSLIHACTGGNCIVSALSGLEDVIVAAQTRLLEAAVRTGVPRFIPSDYCIDYRGLQSGTNRNLDLRRRFAQRIDAAPIRATGILNGMFSDLLTGQAPLVLRKQHRILYWGDATQPLDFTTMDDTAAYTAAAALDESAPRYLQIAGDVLTIEGLRRAAEAATGEPFRRLRAGGLGVLKGMIATTKFLMPARKEVFPPWQGMQYLRDMLSGEAKLHELQNDRYSDLRWKSVQEVLAEAFGKK